MLVLSRKIREAILIGGRVSVRILGVQGGRVRLGIEAPVEISVHRSEVLTNAGCAGRNCGGGQCAVPGAPNHSSAPTSQDPSLSPGGQPMPSFQGSGTR